ncbi:hypothetical protein AB0F17_45845 [Nonomuraea sp. NPDC026600]
MASTTARSRGVPGAMACSTQRRAGSGRWPACAGSNSWASLVCACKKSQS